MYMSMHIGINVCRQTCIAIYMCMYVHRYTYYTYIYSYKLNQHPLQASQERRVARKPAGQKTKPVKGWKNLTQGQWPSSRNTQQSVGDDVT